MLLRCGDQVYLFIVVNGNCLLGCVLYIFIYDMQHASSLLRMLAIAERTHIVYTNKVIHSEVRVRCMYIRQRKCQPQNIVSLRGGCWFGCGCYFLFFFAFFCSFFCCLLTRKMTLLRCGDIGAEDMRSAIYRYDLYSHIQT